MILFAALRLVFPDRPAPPWVEGFTALADPDRLAREMAVAGFGKVSVQQIEGVWERPAGQAYLDEVQDLYGYVGPYVALDRDLRARVDDAIRTITTAQAESGKLRLASPVLIAVGERGREGPERPLG